MLYQYINGIWCKYDLKPYLMACNETRTWQSHNWGTHFWIQAECGIYYCLSFIIEGLEN